MSEFSRRFNEESFWDHVDEVLADNDLMMQPLMPVPRIGEIGGVAIQLSMFSEWLEQQ